MKVIIAGGRDFKNYDKLKRECDSIFKNLQLVNPIIVCGLAKGADLLGKQFAEENGYEVIECPANWELYGKSAGYKRNSEMAECADFLIAFYDGKSKGTSHMIQIMKDLEKFIFLIPYSIEDTIEWF